jgi:hypothetical protein
MPTIKEIVKEYLEKNGYDGLYGLPDCGCSVDDLMPCDEPGVNCAPGYYGPCMCDDDHRFHIYGDRADALAADEERAAAEQAG